MTNPSDFLRGPIYDLKGHVAYIRKLHQRYPLRTHDQWEAFTEDTVGAIAQHRDLGVLREPIRKCVHQLFLFTIYLPEHAIIEDRTTLQEQQVIFGNPEFIENAQLKAITAFIHILNALPAFEQSNLSVPLHTLTKEYPALIAGLIAEFRGAPFEVLENQFRYNILTASGIDPSRDSSRKILMPKDYDGDATDYLHGTPFKDLFNAQVPFSIPRKTWASHAIILGPPNHGKSQLLGSLMAGFLAEPSHDAVGLFLLDPHGDLFNLAKDRVPPERLVVLDPDTNPPPLNFLDFGTSTEAQTLQTFSYLMSSLSGGLSDKQGAIVPYLLKLLRQIPDASLETLRLVVDEKVKNAAQSTFAPFINALPVVDQGFFHNQFYNSRMQETKDAIGWKLYSALSSDAFRQMFSASTNSFDADAAMRERKVVLVKGARTALGDVGMQVFLQFIVAQFFSAALRRERIKEHERHLCLLCIDEAHHVLNSQTANILTECRKYGLGLVAATQVIQQIPDDVKAAIYGATALKIAGPVSHTDASILAREMYTSTEFIRSMKAKERSHADWAFYVQGMTDKAVRVRVPYGALDNLPGRSAELPPTLPPTPKGPSKPEPPSANQIDLPAEADPAIISDDEITTAGPGGWKK